MFLHGELQRLSFGFRGLKQGGHPMAAGVQAQRLRGGGLANERRHAGKPGEASEVMRQPAPGGEEVVQEVRSPRHEEGGLPRKERHLLRMHSSVHTQRWGRNGLSRVSADSRPALEGRPGPRLHARRLPVFAAVMLARWGGEGQKAGEHEGSAMVHVTSFVVGSGRREVQPSRGDPSRAPSDRPHTRTGVDLGSHWPIMARSRREQADERARR